MVSPEISVVMSVYNGESYLKEAIDSILMQTFADFEFIIVDDGSTDSSAAIVKSYSDSRIRLVQQENMGLSKALNKGISLAKGRYIARLDSDDVSLPERLKLQFDFLEKNSKAVIVGSNAIVMDKDGNTIFYSEKKTQWEEIKSILPNTPFYHSATFFRKDTFEKAGGYYEAIKHHFEDVILWNKMAALGELYNLKEPLIKYRVVPEGISNRTVKTGKIMTSIYKNVIQNGGLFASDELLLKQITVPRSAQWKLSNYYLNVGKMFLEINSDKSNARKNIWKAVQHNLFNYIAWFNLLLLILPISYISKWKKGRGVKMPQITQ
jgi:glycosyltransferase involved in cell wall biosynthesis